MLMPDVTEILNDPEVGGGQAFTVRRVQNVRVLGGVERKVTTYAVTGNIQPQELSVQSSTVEDLRNESIVIRAMFDFKVGNNEGGSAFDGEDEVLWDGAVWRITRVENWIKWGFTTAYATRVMDIIEEEPEDPDDPEEPEETEG